MQSGREDILEERYAIELCLKLGKNATKMCGMLQTAFGASCMNRASVFVWNKRFKEDRETVRDVERCGRSKEVNRPELIAQRVRVTMYMCVCVCVCACVCKRILGITFLNEEELILFTELNGFKWCYLTVTIKHQSFVYARLNSQKIIFLTIQSSIIHLFSNILNVKQFSLTHT